MAGARLEWNPEQLAELRSLWAKGWTAKRIGDKLGITRNAVVGKARRLGLEGRVPSVHPRPIQKQVRIVHAAGITKANEARRAAKKRKRHNDGNIRQPTLPSSLAAARRFTDMKEPRSLNVPLVELTEGSCRWPNDKFESPFLFCGNAAAFGSPYCGFHTRCAYEPKPPRIRVAA